MRLESGHDAAYRQPLCPNTNRVFDQKTHEHDSCITVKGRQYGTESRLGSRGLNFVPKLRRPGGDQGRGQGQFSVAGVSLPPLGLARGRHAAVQFSRRRKRLPCGGTVADHFSVKRPSELPCAAPSVPQPACGQP